MELPLLNQYELMWIFVFFDLPVVEKKERKDAAKFRIKEAVPEIFFLVFFAR